MRPQKPRTVRCSAQERLFRPRCVPSAKLSFVVLTLDEFEALRLSDLLGLHQLEAAKLMNVSRPTFSRIASRARQKVADALVNLKGLRIEKGCCRVLEAHNEKDPS